MQKKQDSEQSVGKKKPNCMFALSYRLGCLSHRVIMTVRSGRHRVLGCAEAYILACIKLFWGMTGTRLSQLVWVVPVRCKAWL